MQDLDFESSLELKQINENTFENVHPAWTWWGGGVVPGGLIMAMSAAAAWKTVPDGCALANLHSQFLTGSKPNVPYQYHVRRASDGRRFMVRTVEVKQEGRTVNVVTVGFVNAAQWKGKSLEHTVPRQGKELIDRITVDDLEPGRSANGPFMKFQRLPLMHATPKETQTSTQPVVAHIIGPMRSEPGSKAHTLGIVNLSDFHVLDAPTILSGYSVGLPALGDASGKRTQSTLKVMTSLNHTIHFCAHSGYRADDLTYVEVTSPWASQGRGLARSNIFSKDGALIATCVQETYQVFNPEVKL